jgi:hypothetical protein
MSDLLAFPIAFAIAGVIVAIRNRISRLRKAHEEYGGGAVADDSVVALPSYDDRVLAILKECRLDLTHQGACGFGPWLSSLLDGSPRVWITERTERGVRAEREWTGASPSVALTAVEWTIRELTGRRFCLDALYKARAELEEILGEGA